MFGRLQSDNVKSSDRLRGFNVNNLQETCSALEQMAFQIRLILEKEFVQTKIVFDIIESKLAGLKEQELEETSVNLFRLASDLAPVKEKEFSFMKIFGLENNELVHSSFLVWLLDPLESHGLGSYFAEKLLSQAASKAKLDLSGVDFSKLRVERERSGDKSRFDIRIFDSVGSFQCVFENKIRSGEGADQTSRLYKDFHDETYTRELFVFLTLDPKSHPKNPRFVCLNYSEFLPILRDLIAAAKDDARFLIKHYLNTLERLVMSEKFEGFSERTQLYYQYYKYLEEVKKAFENDRRLLLNTLEEEIKQCSWWDDGIWRIDKSGGDLRIWKTSWRVSKQEGIYLQLYMYITELGFAIRVYGFPSEFSTKFMPIFRRLVDEKYPGKMAGDLKKTFGAGVSRFLEKEIHFNPKEKNQIQKIVASLNEIVAFFDKLIENGINEFKAK